MSIEDLKKVGNLSKDEVLTKMRSGEIVPPLDKKERVEFLNFVGMTGEEKEKILNLGTSPEPKKDEEGNPVVPPAAADEVKKGPDAPLVESWWKKLGYESEEKAAEAHQGLVDLSASQQSTIDRLNAKEGQRGQELKRLRDQNEKMTKEFEVKAPKIVKPDRPKRPDPKQFEDGILDEKYTEAFSKYESDLDSYEQKNEEYIIEKTKQVVVQPPVVDNAPWDKLWNNDIPEFQKTHGLLTTVPIRLISDAYTSISDPEKKAGADAFIKTVSPADLAVYEKVKTAVEFAYDFTSGMPESRYRTIAGALFDNGMTGEGKPFNVVVPGKMTKAEEESARAREQLKKEGTVEPPPSSSLASGDKNIGDQANANDKQKRLKTLLDTYNVALNRGTSARDQFESSPEYQEYLNLRKELGLRVPGK